jgi:hypothetical protein
MRLDFRNMPLCRGIARGWRRTCGPHTATWKDVHDPARRVGALFGPCSTRCPRCKKPPAMKTGGQVISRTGRQRGNSKTPGHSKRNSRTDHTTSSIAIAAAGERLCKKPPAVKPGAKFAAERQMRENARPPSRVGTRTTNHASSAMAIARGGERLCAASAPATNASTSQPPTGSPS